MPRLRSASFLRQISAAPGGEATGVDLSHATVEAARLRFPRSRLRGLRLLAVDIETGEVPGRPFDAAYSRMALLLLLPDPVAGCAAIRRLMRAGARLAATVFRDGADNPWLAAAMLGAAPHVGPLPPLPLDGKPGPFAFAGRRR